MNHFLHSFFFVHPTTISWQQTMVDMVYSSRLGFSPAKCPVDNTAPCVCLYIPYLASESQQGRPMGDELAGRGVVSHCHICLCHYKYALDFESDAQERGKGARSRKGSLVTAAYPGPWTPLEGETGGEFKLSIKCFSYC